MKVICINDSNRPSKIAEKHWIKKGQTYTVIKVVRLALQENKLGLVLKEIKLDKSCFPYEFFDSDRFITAEEIIKKTELKKEADLDSLD